MHHRLIFLDIDGVLNSTRSVIGLKGTAHPAYRDDTKGVEGPEFLDACAVGMIRDLCKRCDAKIVLSSSWRRLGNYERIGQDLDLPIISQTPCLDQRRDDGSMPVRGDEIKRWLEIHCHNKGLDPSYVIVDDDSDMLPEQIWRFVKTDCNNGMLYSHYCRMKELLLDEPNNKQWG